MNITSRCIACTVFLISCLQSFSQLNLEDIFLKGRYYAKTIDDISFLHRSDRYAVLKNTPKGQHILVYNSKAQATDSLELFNFQSADGFPPMRYESLQLSNTDVYYLLKANEEKMYRRSGAANYFVADQKGMIRQVSTGKLSFPQFTADDKRLAYVKYNNLYWYDLEEGLEHVVTTDGQWDSIINGKSDWVYEEELELTSAFAWDPQGEKIAYMKFDERRVKEYKLPVYNGQPYPQTFSYKYPKVGEENSKVSVWVYDVKKNKSVPVKFAGYSYEYIPRIYWNAGGNEVWAMLLNRHQDSLTVVAYNIDTKKTRTVYEDHSDTYVDVPFAFDVLGDNSYVVNSARDGHEHLYHFDSNGKRLQQLTQGNFEITNYYGSDEKNKRIFFQSNEGEIAGRNVYSVNYESLQKQNYANEKGTNTIAFSPGYHYYIRSHSTASDPNTTMIFSANRFDSAMIEDNTSLRASISNFPKKEFTTVTVNGTALEAWIINPPNFDPDKKYPLLMFVYGGPGNQEVLDKWGGTGDRWFSYMAQLGYVVACVDNRGSGGKGSAFEKCVYLNLGKLETADQVAAAKYFAAQPYIDSSRIGIYGISYGGYMAALCLLEGNDVFKTAIAQAPVSDWKYYDNIYTERYMRKPSENKIGYENFNLVNDAHRLKGNLLLIHGMEDDNVHFQNTAEFINALNEAHKTYNLYIYPGNNHGIYGGETRYDLFMKITRFIQEKL